MENYLNAALEIVKAQAAVRNMTTEEITAMLQELTRSIQGIAGGNQPGADAPAVMDPKKSVKEKSVTCLECGKSFKLLTKKHLASHDLDAVIYRAKWGLKPKTALVAKELQRTRRKKMASMKLWERRGTPKKTAKAEPQKPVA
jgi:predicted transcriptional regulator